MKFFTYKKQIHIIQSKHSPKWPFSKLTFEVRINAKRIRNVVYEKFMNSKLLLCCPRLQVRLITHRGAEYAEYLTFRVLFTGLQQPACALQYLYARIVGT